MDIIKKFTNFSLLYIYGMPYIFMMFIKGNFEIDTEI